MKRSHQSSHQPTQPLLKPPGLTSAHIVTQAALGDSWQAAEASKSIPDNPRLSRTRAMARIRPCRPARSTLGAATPTPGTLPHLRCTVRRTFPFRRKAGESLPSRDSRRARGKRQLRADHDHDRPARRQGRRFGWLDGRTATGIVRAPRCCGNGHPWSLAK